ncbi:MAG TPA: proprotein convertase P-domain-containing protein [Phycisphaerales bacterium]|nr:proprotein convertase P-domain-containing protein [Phycisphaerales bacterium]HMP37965.1 proprotein convertase P-domain-containing protein [Phycisphaerales bacterium]
MLRNSLIATAASLAVASFASATVYTGNGFTIPDNNPVGVSSDIVITDEFFVGDITVSLLGLIHTWAGDLTATLTFIDMDNNSVSTTLFERIGRVNTGFGDSSDFGGTYSFNDSFNDANLPFGGNIWTAAAAVGAGLPIAPGNYFATGANSSAQVSLLAAFGGLNAKGTWRLTISDNAAGDLGSLSAWSLDFVKNPIPAPSALALLGLAGLAGGRRRRA